MHVIVIDKQLTDARHETMGSTNRKWQHFFSALNEYLTKNLKTTFPTCETCNVKSEYCFPIYQYKYHNQLYNLYIYLNTFRLTIAQKSVWVENFVIAFAYILHKYIDIKLTCYNTHAEHLSRNITICAYMYIYSCTISNHSIFIDLIHRRCTIISHSLSFSLS